MAQRTGWSVNQDEKAEVAPGQHGTLPLVFLPWLSGELSFTFQTFPTHIFWSNLKLASRVFLCLCSTLDQMHIPVLFPMTA